MSQNITLNGQPYIIPDLSESNWGQNVTDYLVAIPNAVLQKSGGSFILSAELDFGSSYGIKSLYYKSRTTNPASAGQIRLANTDVIAFRNAGNTADLNLGVNGSNQLTFNGVVLESDTLPSGDMFVGDAANSSTARTISGAWTMSNLGVATLSADYITNSMINSAAAIAFTKLAALTASKSLVSDGSGVITTGWGYASGNMTTTANGELRFQDSAGGDYVGFVAPASVTTHTYTLPTAAGTAGQVLSWQAGGQLQWINASGTGTINSGSQYQLAYYAAAGTTLSGLTLITASRALASDANGLPVASATTATELGYVSGVTSAIQTQLGNKLNLAGGIMTGDIAMSGTQKLTGLAAGSVAGDSVRYEQVLLLAGGTMAGNIAFGSSFKLTGLAAGTTNGDSIRYEQVVGQYLPISGGTLTGNLVLPNGTAALPSLTLDATDNDSGLYWVSSNQIGISVNGANSATFLPSEINLYLSGVSKFSLSASTATLSLALAMSSNKITGLAAGTTNGDAIRYEQLVGQYLLLSGGALTGTVTNSGQPSFLVTCGSQTDVTGDGTAHTVVFSTEIADRGSNFNTSTYTFTAPTTGLYQLNTVVRFQNVTAAVTYVQVTISTSNRSYVNTVFLPLATSTVWSVPLSVLADMDASDTVTVIAEAGGTTKTIDIQSGSFSGFLVA